MLKLARWSTTHRKYVLLGWVVLLLAVNALAQSAGTHYSNNFTLPNSDAQRANELSKDAAKPVIAAARAAVGPGLQVELGGQAIEASQQEGFGLSTAVGLLAAIVVLLLTFGSLTAMGLPIVTALLGLGTGLGVIALGTNVLDTANFSSELAAMIGLGVGIDYALFIVTRFRELYATPGPTFGHPRESAVQAMDTAGRAVLFAGVTVVIALLGMMLLGVNFLYGVAIATASALTMLAIAAPATALRLGSSDAGNDPTSFTTHRAYELLANGFGQGFNGPLLVVAKVPNPKREAAENGVLLTEPPPSGGTAVEKLRAAISSTPGVVVLLSALLLMIVFRSLVIPLQAAVMNLLSIGASLGVIVAIFQWGWLSGLMGVSQGPIESFIPVMLFAIVFGLSMDYEVFLVSRIHERWVRTAEHSAAVGDGLALTGRVVTAAGAIMVCVFLSFMLGENRVIKEFGLSLASAVFLDALVVRCLLLPAVLSIIGQRTWQLPAWLDRLLPRLNIEGSAVSSTGEHTEGTAHASPRTRGEVATEGADG